ncbi:KTSC domain-containing protein [Carnobacterium sp. PL12RED10]|uniref:KTSC domain-containing protein n=1 Tax=Carnobacterium sp. PL12RED10 TaxID=2592351 RepID=UPI0011EEE9B2|nr:KTSC domain-containing protein [Carnobacterium sp. PL12RED10]KAF3299352.1 KTSC domain-containing protein [Carnobacterium sp. PL12RED10]
MNLIPVHSSNLQAVGYNPEKLELIIAFKGNRVYKYTGVPDFIFSNLMNSPSKGSYHHKFIKNNYPAFRIG